MPDRDERLAALLDQLKDEQRRGLSPNLDAVAGQHPDLADELRQLWAVMQFLSNPPDGDRTVTLPQSVNPPSGTLPREFGDYELLAEIGRGGMGIVYKARQKSLGRTVALKMLLHGDVARPEDRARIRAEAQAAVYGAQTRKT